MRLEYALLGVFALFGEATNFTIVNGQIFTPGLAIVDAPQPNTPLGGDTLEVALDVSGDGKLPLPPYQDGQPTQIHNITIFLTSYITGFNFTITNGTASEGNASLGDIMLSEPGSTVKHVKWKWPACLVGDGFPKDNSTARGLYNISMHQSYLLNNTNYYTIFNLPISVTNSIENDTSRASCDVLLNTLRSDADQVASAQTIAPASYPWTNGQGTESIVPAPSSATTGSSGSGSSSPSSSSSSSYSSSSYSSSSTPNIGGQKPDAQPGNGLGSGAALSKTPSQILGACGTAILLLLLL